MLQICSLMLHIIQILEDQDLEFTVKATRNLSLKSLALTKTLPA